MSDYFFLQLSELASRSQDLAPGETLFRAGSRVSSMFLVAAGKICLSRSLPHGAALHLQEAEPGSLVAEASLFAKTYHCDSVALVASTVHVIPRRRMEEALSSDSELSRNWIFRLAKEVQRTRAIAEILSLKKVEERVDAWIALNDGNLPAKGSWRQLAGQIGVTPEALYRELRRRRSTP